MLKEALGFIAAVSGNVKSAIAGVHSPLGGNILREGEAASGSQIVIDFDPSQMFVYSNVIIQCMMPVVYITAGLSLGFTVVYALKSAFSSRF